jgi:ADP-heptose:LPS heptosyltransferase
MSLQWNSNTGTRMPPFMLPGTEPAMEPSLVPQDLLARADKILFVAHLALGDFAYLQSCFEAFARDFPHIRLHLWVDERRRTDDAAAWPHLKKYALYDWLDHCPYFDKVYKETYSPALYEASVRAAQAEAYPIVVTLAMLERHKYVNLARLISPHGFVVGQKKRVRPYDIVKHLIYRKLDAHIRAYTSKSHPNLHISDIFAEWFTQMFGIEIPVPDRYPVVAIPDEWMAYAQAQFGAWGFAPGADVMFVNAFSKCSERSWPLARVIELIRALRTEPRWRATGFIVNVVPEELERARALFAGQDLEGTHLFSAQDNFFQLPAILGLCSLVVSVETAVMHLANAVHVPVVALMRLNNPEWAPIDSASSTVLTVARPDDHIDRIGVAEVVAAIARRQR